jgi:hypothetical protein
MSKFRFVHNQDQEGEILIDDVEDGLPNKPFGRFRKQQVYIPYHRKYTEVKASGEVVVKEDRSKPGFVDLVRTEQVEKSIQNGALSGLADKGDLNKIEVQAGQDDPPSIDSAYVDTPESTSTHGINVDINDGTSVAETYEITLNTPDISSTTVSFTDPTAGADESTTIASGLQNEIQNNSTLNPEFVVQVNTDTLTISTKNPEVTMSYSVNVTDPDGAINASDFTTGRIVVKGSSFISVNPFDSSVSITSSEATDTDFTRQEIETSWSESPYNDGYKDDVVVLNMGLHGIIPPFSSSDVEDVSVTSNGETDTSSVSGS